MFRKEWPLIMYTLIIQLAAGLFTFLAVYRFLLAGKSGSEIAIAITAPGMTLAGPVILLGILLSLFHLGNPFRAYKSVNNIGSSWLSREVFFTGGFFGLWLISFLLERNGMSNIVFMWLTVAIGLVTILSMSWIYYSTESTGWYSLNTFTAFFGAMIVFGCISSSVFMAVSGISVVSAKALLVPFLVLALVVLIIRFLHQFMLVSKLKSVKDVWSMDNLVTAAPSMSEILPSYRTLTFAGLLLALIGVVLVLYTVSVGAIVLPLLMVAGVLAIAGELMARIGFYSLGLAKEAE